MKPWQRGNQEAPQELRNYTNPISSLKSLTITGASVNNGKLEGSLFAKGSSGAVGGMLPVPLVLEAEL